MSLGHSSACSFPSAELLVMNDFLKHTEEVEEEEMQSRGVMKRNGEQRIRQARKDLGRVNGEIYPEN